MTSSTVPIAEAFARDGYVFPCGVLNEVEAGEIRADLEAGEAALAERPSELSLLRGYPAQLLPSFAALIRRSGLIEAVSEILGPDLLVWGSGLFIKEANTPSYVSWHQDLTYWGLDDVQEVTAWIALSPATTESGCMRFVPGSHKRRLVPHVDTFADDNLLTRGQEIAVDVDDSEAVDVSLRPGQASLYHGHLFHGSGPNGTGDRRIGAAIRYITPTMKQASGVRPLAVLVSGEDRYGHFKLASPPDDRLRESDFALCRRDAEVKRRVLYEGAEQQDE